MTHPIPAPRPISDRLYRTPPPLPRRTPLVGPFCPACVHRSCRRRRAQRLPLRGGHRDEYRREHAWAAAVQRRYRHLVIWWGEATQSFWAATPAGLEEAPDIDALLLLLWPHATPPATPRTEPAPEPAPIAAPTSAPAAAPAAAPPVPLAGLPGTRPPSTLTLRPWELAAVSSRPRLPAAA